MAEGEIFGILGHNGAGKTTVECVAGLRTPDAGQITVLGLEPQRDAVRLRHLVGMQLQESELPDRMTVAGALRLCASYYADPAEPRAGCPPTPARSRAVASARRKACGSAFLLAGQPELGQQRAGAGLGLALIAIATTMLVRARAYRTVLLARKRELEEPSTPSKPDPARDEGGTASEAATMSTRNRLPVDPLALAMRHHPGGCAGRRIAIAALILGLALVAGVALLLR